MTQSTPPLHGLRVIDLAGEAGLFAGRELGELGADVIRVEPPGGDAVRRRRPFLGGEAGVERSLHHQHFNANKRGVVLDLAAPAGRDALQRLVGSGDVLLHTLRPDERDALGLGDDALRVLQPSLVQVALAPFAVDGPMRDYRGNDLVAAAASGLMYLNGFPEDPPNVPGAEQAYHMGSLVAAAGALIAVVGRERDPSRGGARIDVALQDAAAMATLQIANANIFAWHGTVPRRTGVAGATGARSLFPCRDGRWISFVVPLGAPHLWEAFVAWMVEEGIGAPLRAPEWSDPFHRARNASVTAGVIEALCARHDRAELFREGQRRRMLVMPVSNARDLLEDEHLRARSFFSRYPQPALGGIELEDAGPPYRFSATPVAPTRPAPALGQHTAEVLAKLVTAAADTPPAGARATDATAAADMPPTDARATDATAAADTPPTDARATDATAAADMPPTDARATDATAAADTPPTDARATDATAAADMPPTPAAADTPPTDARETAGPDGLAGPATRAARPGGAQSEGVRLPLHGLRVADFFWLIAGPSASRMLADFGADVIKIESESRVDNIRTIGVQPSEPGSINTNGVFNDCNASKRSVTLNLNHPRGIELAKDIVARSDIVTNNFTADRMDRWGLGYDDLREVKPDIIMLTMPVMGRSGPYKSYGSYGNGVIAYSGLSSNMGFPDRPPTGIAPLYSDFSAPYVAVAALMAALYHREHTGEGQHIELAQAEATINLLGSGILETSANGELPPRLGNRSRDCAPHGAYPCVGEDRWLAIACVDDAEWARLAAAIEQPALATDPRFATLDARKAHEDALDALITAWTRGREPWAAMRLLQGRGVMAAVVEDLEDMVTRDPWLSTRHFVPLAREDEEIVFATHSQPARLNGASVPSRRAPYFGEDNEAVFKGLLGISDGEYAALLAEGVLH